MKLKTSTIGRKMSQRYLITLADFPKEFHHLAQFGSQKPQNDPPWLEVCTNFGQVLMLPCFSTPQITRKNKRCLLILDFVLCTYLGLS